MHTIQYYSYNIVLFPSLRRKEILTYTTWMSFHIMLNEMKMKYLEESNPQRQKVEWWVPGPGGRKRAGSFWVMGTVSVLQVAKTS